MSLGDTWDMFTIQAGKDGLWGLLDVLKKLVDKIQKIT
jgi:hypothetical protein